jgi:hypothetical protein
MSIRTRACFGSDSPRASIGIVGRAERLDHDNEVTMDAKLLMTLPEFLTLCSISRTAAYREAAAGRLRFTKCGRRTLVADQDAKAFVASLRGQTGDAKAA